jgi:hypothetical protein
MYSYGNRTIEDFRRLEYLINYKNQDSNVFKLEEVRERYAFDTVYSDPLFNFDVKSYTVEEIEPWKYPHILYQLEQLNWNWADFQTLKYYSDLLAPNPNSEIQNQLTLNILGYCNILTIRRNLVQPSGINTFLKLNHIPVPRTLAGTPVTINNLKRKYFTEKEIKKVEQLLQEEPLKAELRTLLVNKLLTLDQIRDVHHIGNQILNIIKEQYPVIKPNYPNIGIIGSALDGWIVPDRVMILTNEDSLIWETDVILKEGSVKFKSDNNWTNHWGGSHFPKGRADFWGDDIVVEPGKYHVILNLTENTYEFIKLDK